MSNSTLPSRPSLEYLRKLAKDLYEFLKSRQLERSDVEFVQTLHEPVHGGREFSIRDPNELTLRFLQEAK